MERIRKAGNKNRFYPGSAAQIDEMIAYWNTVTEENIKDKNLLRLKPEAIISPHAGYVYSGFTANMAHRLLPNNKLIKRAIVIGPSHHVYIESISISEYDLYETPYGFLEIDTAYMDVLKLNFDFEFSPDAHFLEHSTETQMPFIKRYNPGIKVIELIYGNIHYDTLAKIISFILADKTNAVVISTDLSHFHPLEVAEKIDSNCLIGVKEKDIALLLQKCEACGKTGMVAITKAAKAFDLTPVLLDYRTSADVSKDTERVVGYMSAAFI